MLAITRLTQDPACQKDPTLVDALYALVFGTPAERATAAPRVGALIEQREARDAAPDGLRLATHAFASGSNDPPTAEQRAAWWRDALAKGRTTRAQLGRRRACTRTAESSIRRRRRRAEARVPIINYHLSRARRALSSLVDCAVKGEALPGSSGRRILSDLFAPFGGIKYVHLETASWMPKTGLPMIETYSSATITYLNKTSAMAAEREMDGFIFIGGHVPDSHPHPAIKIKFAGGPVDDDDDDGSDGGMHEMLRQHNDSMYMSRSLNDEGIAALYPVGVDWESMGVWEDDDDDDVLGGHGGDLADFDPDADDDF